MDSQRSDLWILDISSVARGFSADLSQPYVYLESVSPAGQNVGVEVTRRDSTNYNMPGWDDAFGGFAATFRYDAGSSTRTSSQVYNLLTQWRNSVRTGRGSVAGEEPLWLDAANNYRIPCFFDVTLYLLRGVAFTSGVNTFGVTKKFTFKNSWLATRQLSTLEYRPASPVLVACQIHSEDMMDLDSGDSTDELVLG